MATLAIATSELAEQLMANALKHQLQFCKRRTNPMANKQTVQPMGGHRGKAEEEEGGANEETRGEKEEGVQIDNVPSVLP